MQKIILICGSIFAGLSVVLGAFGAHALKTKLTAEQLQVFQTGVSYQFYHSLALLLLGVLMMKTDSLLLNYSGIAFIIGILFFSGSLYLLSTVSINGMAALKPVLGPITPLGGLCFIIGWSLLAVSIYRTS